MILQKLLSSIGFVPDKQSIKMVDKTLDNIKGKLMAVAALAAPAILFKSGFDRLQEVAKTADGFAKTARQIDITAESLQELNYAAGLSGATQEQVVAAIDGTNKAVREARTGNVEMARSFMLAGLSVGKLSKMKPEERFEAIGLALRNVKDEGKRAVLTAKLLGGDGKKFASFFMAGAEGIAKMKQEARDLNLIIPEGMTVQAEAFNDSLDRIKKQVAAVTDRLLMGLIPALQPLLDDLTKWIKEDAKDANGFFQQLTIDLHELIKAVHGGLKDIREFSKEMGGLGNVMGTFAAIVGSFVAGAALIKMVRAVSLLTMANLKLAASTVAAAAPYVLLGLMIAAIVFTLQDLYTWMEGGESYFGDAFGPANQENLRKVQDGLMAVAAVIVLLAVSFATLPIMIVLLIAMLIALVLYWDEVKATMIEFADVAGAELKNLGNDIWRWLSGGFKKFGAWVEGFWDGLVEGLAEKFRKVVEPAMAAYDKVSGLASSASDKISGLFGGGRGAATDALAATARTQNGAPRQDVTIGTIQVDASAAMTPDELQQATTDGVNDAMLREAQRGFAPRATGT